MATPISTALANGLSQISQARNSIHTTQKAFQRIVALDATEMTKQLRQAVSGIEANLTQADAWLRQAADVDGSARLELENARRDFSTLKGRCEIAYKKKPLPTLLESRPSSSRPAATGDVRSIQADLQVSIDALDRARASIAAPSSTDLNTLPLETLAQMLSARLESSASMQTGPAMDDLHKAILNKKAEQQQRQRESEKAHQKSKEVNFNELSLEELEQISQEMSAVNTSTELRRQQQHGKPGQLASSIALQLGTSKTHLERSDELHRVIARKKAERAQQEEAKKREREKEGQPRLVTPPVSSTERTATGWMHTSRDIDGGFHISEFSFDFLRQQRGQR